MSLGEVWQGAPVHRSRLRFGALVWAAAAKDPHPTPELIMEMVARVAE